MSYFTFSEMSKLLPASDDACPGRSCLDDGEILVQLSMTQDTAHPDPKNIGNFQLAAPSSLSRSDQDALSLLVLKNESHTTGHLYL